LTFVYFQQLTFFLENTCTLRTLFATCCSFANSFSASYSQREELISQIFQNFRISCLVLAERFYQLEVSVCFGRKSQLGMSLIDDQFMMRLDTCGRTIFSVFTIYSSSLFSLLGFTLPPFVLVAAFVK